MEIRDLVERVRADTRGGAAEVVRTAADVLRQGLARCTASTAAGVREEMALLGDALVRAQPAMAPVRVLVEQVLAAIVTEAESSAVAPATGRGHTAAVARAGGERALDAFLRRLAAAPGEAARRAAALVPADGRVLTLSRSSTVLTALLEAARCAALEVVCLEGRPGLEGRRLAGELAAAGIAVTLAADAAVAALIAGCDIALVGADAIDDAGVVNKIGTRACALAARDAGVPCYAVADSTKLLPPGTAQPLEDERPPRELWPDAPADVRVWNRYFEATPVELFAGVVLEDGIYEHESLRKRRRAQYAAGERR